MSRRRTDRQKLVALTVMGAVGSDRGAIIRAVEGVNDLTNRRRSRPTRAKSKY